MHVAELSLCKQLYELSGWNSGRRAFYTFNDGKLVETNAFDEDMLGEIRLYDLGYLLRKLPRDIDLSDWGLSSENGYFVFLGLEPSSIDEKEWLAFYSDDDHHMDERFVSSADTPEDATAGLCILLFKQNILTPTTSIGGEK